jgi:hypothetical protein
MSDQHEPAGERTYAAEGGDPADVERIAREAAAGRGLGGRTLGELGTTGGTNVGVKQQERTETGVAGRRTPAGRRGDPGVAGRTARGGLGADLDDAIEGHAGQEPVLLPDAEPDDGRRSTPRD